MDSFFVSCPIHFEDDLIQEIESFWFQMIDLDGLPTRAPFPEFYKESGGLEFKAPLHLGLQINFFSKLANRVLFRVIHFESRYFDHFQKNIEKIDFKKYFAADSVQVNVESSKSRLFHETNLMEALQNSFAKKKIKIDKSSPVEIFIRIHKDFVTVSLDTSGAHLHFRGYRKFQGEAPIRENLAYLMLQKAKLNTHQARTFIDPFAGAGTLLFEAALCGFPNFSRDYAFFHLKICPGLFKSESWKKNFRWLVNKPFGHGIGFEIDPATHEKSLQNKSIFENVLRPSQVDLRLQNSIEVDMGQLNKEVSDPIWLVTNPPYGERLKQADVGKILARFEALDQLAGAVVVHPKDWNFTFKRLKLTEATAFSNQGLKLQLSVFKT